MLAESIVTAFDWSCIGKTSEGKTSECIFWTGREGQMCVQYFRPNGDVFYQPHAHSEYTLVICLAGEVAVNQLGHEQVIGPGEVMIGNCGVEHTSSYHARNGQPCEAVSIALDPRLLSVLAADFHLPGKTDGRCPAFTGKAQGALFLDCATGIAQELKHKQLGHKIVIETQAIRLLVEAVRSWPRAKVTEIPDDNSPRLPRREFVRAYEFMRWCRKENFRMQHLCRFLGSSEERFTRLFMASTRHTPASFYNRLLLAQACDLLRNPKLSVKEVGFDLGFKTSSHFIATFHREFGISPLEYRHSDKFSRNN